MAPATLVRVAEGFFKRHEVRLLAVWMALLALAAGWLLSTRPGYRIEGDFLVREANGVVDEWLLEQLANPIAEQRARAYLALGRIGGEGTLERLMAALEDPAPSVLAAAAFGVGLLEDAAWRDRPPRPEAAEALLPLVEDEDRRVVSNAVEALGKMRWTPAAERVAASVAPVAVTAAALVRMGAREQIPWLVDRLASDDQDVRWAATTALDALEADCAEPLEQAIVTLARDQNNFVRAAVAGYLARCPSPEAVTALEKLAADADPKVRLQAIQALAALDAGRQMRLGALGDPNPYVRGAAAVSLPEIEAEIAAPQEAPLLPMPLGASAFAAPPELEPRAGQELARTLGRRLLLETELGTFEIELDYEFAPLAAERFYRLATEGAFDGQPFGRVRAGRYAQAGAESPPLRSQVNPRPFLRGSLGLARADRTIDAPEFFIAQTPLLLADGRYTNIGRLVSGDALLDLLTPETGVLAIRPIAP